MLTRGQRVLQLRSRSDSPEKIAAQLDVFLQKAQQNAIIKETERAKLETAQDSLIQRVLDSQVDLDDEQAKHHVMFHKIVVKIYQRLIFFIIFIIIQSSKANFGGTSTWPTNPKLCFEFSPFKTTKTVNYILHNVKIAPVTC